MRILVVVDMQKDFISGSLGTKEAKEIVPFVKRKIEKYKIEGNEIIYTRDTHKENYLETQEGKNLPAKHCIENTAGWEISKELDTQGYKIINKATFGSLELVDYLKNKYNNIEQIEIIGLCTDICVISNAMLLKAAFTETKIKVDSKCCAGVTEKSHKNALDAMEMCQIIIN